MFKRQTVIPVKMPSAKIRVELNKPETVFLARTPHRIYTSKKLKLKCSDNSDYSLKKSNSFNLANSGNSSYCADIWLKYYLNAS